MSDIAAGDIELRASDGHRLGAYEAHPRGAVAAVVVAQEVFGVNAHIRDVVERFAGLGYRAIAPAMFDRLDRDVQLDYTAGGLARGRSLRESLDWDVSVNEDLAAAVDHVRDTGPAAVVGYCYGGGLAWLAANALGGRIAAAVGYYGGQVHDFIHRPPAVPTMLHFGGDDPLIPLSHVEAVAARHPEVSVHLYDGADHGFNCDARASFHPAAAALAQRRTLAFLESCGVGP